MELNLKAACKGSETPVSDHFVDVNKMVSAGATHKDIGDIQLSRYSCYLVRISLKSIYYARSLYALSPNRVRHFIAKGTLKKLDELHRYNIF